MSAKKPKDPHNFKEIGEYNVKDPLGEGVNGAVRLGVHKETGVKVRPHFFTYSVFPPLHSFWFPPPSPAAAAAAAADGGADGRGVGCPQVYFED